MEIRLSEDVQARLERLSHETGRSTGEFVQDAIAGYFDELAQVRSMLDSRYEDIVTGCVKLIPGEEVVAHLRDRSTVKRRQTA